MSTQPSSPASFASTETCRCLITAFQDESRARQQYLLGARRCEQQELFVLSYALQFTAAQEKEHAAIFHGLLSAFGGGCITASSTPEALPEDPLEMLRTIAGEEEKAACQRYPAWARIAQEEDYPRIATAFQRIAETERLHASRFRQYAHALEDGTLFYSPARTGWLCLACGHLRYSQAASQRCSTCGRDRGHFIRSDFHPFTVIC